jgi:ATP-dependent Clp protease protease subunit
MDINENIEQFHNNGLWIPSRTIKLEVEVLEGETEPELTHKAASQFFKNLQILEDLNSDPIRVYMNCPGGSVTAGMAIYNAIDSSPCRVTGIVLGEAASMGSVLLQAFDWRVAFPYSRFMLHDGSTEISGTVRNIEKAIEFDKADRLEMYRIFAKRTGQKSTYWSRKLQQDYYLNAKQALDEGLIDEIWTKR